MQTVSDGERLSDAGSDLERVLLRAGAEEAPAVESVRRAARALGLLPATALVSAAVAACFKVLKASWFVTLVVPAVGISLIGYALAGGVGHRPWGDDLRATTVRWASPPAPTSEAPISAIDTPMVAAQAVGHTATAAGPASLSAARDGWQQGSAERAPVAPAPAAGAAPSRGRAEDLTRQLALIDQARVSAAAGDNGGAIRAVDSYERGFAAGVFAEEAALIRLESVTARGDRAAAAGLAKRFLAAYPRSVHAEAVAAILRRNAS